MTTRTVLRDTVAPRQVAPQRAPEAYVAAPSGGAPMSGYAAAAPYSPAPPPAVYGAAQPIAPPPPMTVSDARDRQFEVLNEAVAALRQELARSYENSQRLTQENEKLRTVVNSLRREIAKGKSSNKVLKDHLQALEKRMKELRPPPLEPSAKAPAEAPRAAPPAQAPAPPPVVAGGDTADGGFDTGAPPDDGATED